MSREYSDVKIEKKEMVRETQNNLLDIGRLLDDAFKGLRRYWILFLVIISICSSLFYFQEISSYVPEYYADITVIVNANTALNYSASYYNKATAEQMAKTFPYIISNSALKHIIAEDLGVTSIPGKITATAMEDTNLITIGVTANTPENAHNILQSVMKNYPEIARVVVGETELIVIDESGIPTYPKNPLRPKSAAQKGFLVGAVLCVVWVVLYALTRRTIRREEDFKNMLNVKCLGCIPKVRFKKRTKTEKNLLLVDNPLVSYGFTESNRTIRTRIEKDSLENNAKVYMISSAIAREGKSTGAANVALSLASKGKKVALVDLDLRNPSVRGTIGIECGEKGVIDVIKGDAAIQDIMVPYKETSLMVLPGGTPIQNTSGVLSGEKIKEICAELRKTMDYIIVDTPPSSLLTDAAQVVKHMDAGIFVVRQDYASTDSILDGIEMLTDTGLRLLGCVLNYAQSGITGYGYGYGYYGYGSYGSYGKYGKYGKYGRLVSTEDSTGNAKD